MCDIKAKKVTATGALAVGPARIKGLSLIPVAAGNITVRDGGATGEVVLDVAIEAASDSQLNIPGDGIRCVNDPHITLTAVTSVTVFYG